MPMAFLQTVNLHWQQTVCHVCVCVCVCVFDITSAVHPSQGYNFLDGGGLPDQHADNKVFLIPFSWKHNVLDFEIAPLSPY